MTASIDHSVNIRNAVDVTLQLLTALFTIGLIFWARRVAPIHRIAFYYGLGSLIDGFATLSGSTNAWKYQLATPLTIMVLSWVAQRRADSPWPAVGALSLMGAISIVYDYRSNFGMCVVAALLVLWYSRKPKRSARRLGAISVAVLLGAAMVAVYYIGTALIVHGYLGTKLQTRSVAQIQASGSLIAGGRLCVCVPGLTAHLRKLKICYVRMEYHGANGRGASASCGVALRSGRWRRHGRRRLYGRGGLVRRRRPHSRGGWRGRRGQSG